jgi:hypothetical protein
MLDITTAKFNACIKHHSGGSTFLGYLYLKVLFAGGFTLGLTDIAVRITRNGTFAIEFPTRVATVKGKEERFPHYFTASKESREWLTATVEALPELQATLQLVRAARAVA